MVRTMTPEQNHSAELLRSRPYGGKALATRMAKDTGGRRFRYLHFTARHGWHRSEHTPWRVHLLPDSLVN